jgi:hypothetical protein
MPVDDAPLVEHSTANAILGRWRNLYVTHWKQRSDAREIMALYEKQLRYLERSGVRIASLTIIERAAIGALDDDMRAAIDFASTHVLSKVLVGATVVPASGFGGAMIRSVLTGLNLIRRLPFANKVTESVAEGCAFVAPHVSGGATAAEVEAACGSIASSPPR